MVFRGYAGPVTHIPCFPQSTETDMLTPRSRNRNILMARYIVRVELLGADPRDYDMLQKNMKAMGFSREIKDADGKRFDLPASEYTIVRDSSTRCVREEVRKIASRIKTQYYVLVSEAADTAWYLEKK